MTGMMPIAGLNDIFNDARTARARSWQFRENILFSIVFELGSSNLTCRQYTSPSFIIYTDISCGGHSSRSKVTRVSKFQRRVATLIFTLSSPNKNQIVRFLIFFPTVSSILPYDFRFLHYKHLRNFLLLSFLVIFWDPRQQFCGHSTAPSVFISQPWQAHN